MIKLFLSALFDNKNVTNKNYSKTPSIELDSPPKPKPRFTLRKNTAGSGWWYIYDEKLQKNLKSIVYDEDRRFLDLFNRFISWGDESRFQAVSVSGRDYPYSFVIDLKTSKETSDFRSIEDAKKFAKGLNDLNNDRNLLEIAKKSIAEFNNGNRYVVKKEQWHNSYTVYDCKRRCYITMLDEKLETFDEAQLIAHLFNLIDENKI